MANRLDYYFRQRVNEAELDQGFAQLEAADRNLAADLGFVGVLANAVVSQHAPVANLTVDVSGPGAILDQLGQRIFFSALQNVNVAQDDSGVSTEVASAGMERIVSVFVQFDRVLSDPRVDGNTLTVFFRRDESFRFVVSQGVEAPAGSALPPPLRSDAILLADVSRRFGQSQVLTGDISTARRQDAFVFSGNPRSLRQGRTLEALSDLLTFYNAHASGTADRHPASAIDYTGGGDWADGTANPSVTVQGQLDKLVSDLATAPGAAKVGASATPASPNALAAGSVKTQLDAMLGFINAHLSQVSGAHAASAISCDGGGNWRDGTTNPASTVEVQLDKIIDDLTTDAGAARIGVGSRSSWLDGRPNPSGVSVRDALDKIIADLVEQGPGVDGARRIGATASGNLPAGSVRTQLDALDATSVRTDIANVFSQTQVVNGAAGETSAALQTTSATATRKLLWEINLGSNYSVRFYATARTLEITLNARWTGTQWAKDRVGWWSTRFDINNHQFRCLTESSLNGAFADSAFVGGIVFALGPTGAGQVFDTNGNFTGPGTTETYIGWQGQSPPSGTTNVGAGAPFRKMFPATPSSITFVVLSSANLARGPYAFMPAASGTGAFIVPLNANANTHFFARVIAT